MPYYDTIDEDLARAKAILAKGREVRLLNPTDPECSPEIESVGIAGADIDAAYKLLESFVAEIERLRDALLAIEEHMAAEKRCDFVEHAQLQADYTEAVRLYRERDAQAARYHDRLQIDPGGSDAIDGLQAAVEMLRAQNERLRDEIVTLHANDDTKWEEPVQVPPAKQPWVTPAVVTTDEKDRSEDHDE